MTDLSSSQFAYEQPNDGWSNAEEKQIEDGIRSALKFLVSDATLIADWVEGALDPTQYSDDVYGEILDGVGKTLKGLLA
jgi:hypothetical protein